MTFIANQDIGDFRKGDVVPDEQAAIWNNMFLDHPCDEQEQKVVQHVEEKKPDVKKRK